MANRNARKPHTSMRGVVVDMEAMRAAAEEQVAIGNARMNARGDVLGKGGQIEIRREQIIRDFYNRNPQGTMPISLKPAQPDSFETPAQAMARMASNTERAPAPKSTVQDDNASESDGKKSRKLVNKGD